MHLFFDTVWKLHIGEIPEKPHEFIDEIEQYDIWEEYRSEIAILKQNALTVDNEEIIGDVIDKLRITNHCGTDFYEWTGSCFKTDICSKGDRCTGSDLTCEGHPIWVAILTLPEEKKNTMENLTKEQAAIKWLLDTLRPFENMEALGPLECFKIREIESLIKEPTASGSVAAPKEEPSDNLDLEKFMLSCPFDVQKFVFNQANRIVSLRQQLKEREEALKELLPLIEEPERLIQECIMDYSEVKFCPIRQGKGNQCRHCFDKAIIERARKLLSK